MGSLLRLFARFGGFFLFVLLEGICFYLIVQLNTKQGQIWFSSANFLVGKAYDTYDSAVDYIHLKEEIAQLMEDNARLRRTLEATRPAIDTALVDTARLDTITQIFSYIPADIINNSINRFNNYLTIDRGRSDSIAASMGVISEDGVVGIVRAVSENYASVLSILHPETRISASVKRNKYFGSLVWTGDDPQYMELQAIPKYAVVLAGDTIVTSGYSSIFPAGIFIGTVENVVLKSGDNFFSIQVKLNIDMGTIRHAYVVKNLYREELTKLSEGEKNE